MPERIDWLDDGTASGAPFSPRFGDRYRGELGGLDQSREVFLNGCGLPAAWANHQQWKILETGFGLGLNFLVTWAAWKADPLRPRMLHFVSTEAFPASAEDVLRGAFAHPELLPLATELKVQFWGLLPGFHRLVFEGGQVLLTLCIGDAKTSLREQQFEADSVYLDGFSPAKNPDIWDLHTLKAVARCCRRGTRIATWTVARKVRDALMQCGFVVEKVPGSPPKRDRLQGQYNPPWEPKKPAAWPQPAAKTPSSCVVIGAGLAGSAVASSLARRGWQVLVLDAESAPAGGASGLPAGLLVPHVSPDDSLLSRLSRSGVRTTLQQAHALLKQGQQGGDWGHTGVLECRVGEINRSVQRALPADWTEDWFEAAADWCSIATPAQLASAGLENTGGATSTSLWHAQAGWVKPASLVNAWLAAPGITWRGNAQVAKLQPAATGWQLLNAAGEVLAHADLIVMAAGHASVALAASVSPEPLALQAIRGQVSWGLHSAGHELQKSLHEEFGELPPFPVNGHGGLIPAVPGMDDMGGMAWIMGASYERDCELPNLKPQDHKDNFERLQALLPKAAAQLADDFNSDQVKGWAGIRCATPGRLPVLKQIAADATSAGVWVCSGMGSRGLSFAGLCAELLAARLHGEPLPLEHRLARRLLAMRA
ncbi:MAG: FAD-dependent 5-carboxymethylaminomethyl-2-thiouridine(34) oxidoreductase MnmC [Polaromonas sp.]|nr:FAD-dependent 5-carboxymethylaminomethyl-2-thiouridine(34) oxidoreductase MnmC [Polaromonas sp.]